MLAEIAGPENAARILAFTRVEGTSALTLEKLRARWAAGADDRSIARLTAVGECLEQLGVASLLRPGSLHHPGTGLLHGDRFRDVSLRSSRHRLGLLGGRYNDLASLYTKQSLPGVGASIGIDRLMAAMEELGLAAQARPPPRCSYSAWRRASSARTIGSRSPRAAGMAAEVFPEKKKLAVQFAYAEKKGIPLAAGVRRGGGEGGGRRPEGPALPPELRPAHAGGGDRKS